MDESTVQSEIRWLLIREQVVEHDLDRGFILSLLRLAYARGYTCALEDPDADLEQAAIVAASTFCRLPV